MKKAILISFLLFSTAFVSFNTYSINIGSINPNNRETTPRLTNQAPTVVLEKTFTAKK